MKTPHRLKYLSLAGFAAVAFLSGPTAQAVSIIDQSQYTFDTGIPFNFFPPPNYPVGQSFTAGLNGLLTDITVASNGQISSGGSLTLEVRSGNGTGGTLLGTINALYSANSYDFIKNWYAVDVNVSSLGINVVSGSQYTFLFTNVTGSDFPSRGLLANDTNPYAGGRAYSGPGYGNIPSWDLMFNTQVNQNVPDGGTTAALLGTALLGIAALRRRFSRV